MKLEVGKEYIINHSRKGTFIGKLLKDSGEWITVEVTKGRAQYISSMNVGRGVVGDTITLRKSFCLFNEVEEKTANV